MKSHLISASILTATMLVLSSCQTERNETQREVYEIKIDLSDAENVDLSSPSLPKRILKEEDHSLIDAIRLVEYADNQMYIFSQDKLSVYTPDGTFSHSIGKLGEGPGEYLSIATFWIESDRVYIHDSKAKAILTYTLKGDFVEKTRYRPDDLTNFKYIIPLDRDHYAAYNVYAGDTPMPKFSILDKQFKIKNKFGALLEHGIAYMVPFARYNNEVLCCEILNDTLFSITNREVYPKYYLNFLSDKLTIPDFDPQKTMRYLHSIEKDPAMKSKASLIHYANENDRHLSFCFSKEGFIHLAIHHKKEGNTKVYKLFSSSENISTYRTFAQLLSNKVIVSCNIENPELKQEYHAFVEIPIRN